MTATLQSSSSAELRRIAAGEVASVHVGCPVCGESYILPLGSPAAGAGGGLACESCGTRIPFDRARLASSSGSPPRACAVCGCEEFYLQKDFNRALGLWIVVGSGLVALLAMAYHHLIGLGVLVGVTLLDWLLFHRLKAVTVCYLCQAIYRGFPPDPAQRAFYLGNEERFKKARQEWVKSLRP